MENYQYLQSFFGWGAIIGSVLLMFSTLMLLIFRSFAVKIHQRIIPLSAEKVNESYFNYLAMFKIGVIIFFIIPYFACVFMKS